MNALPGPTCVHLGGFAPGYYGRMWGLDWCLLESNIIELNLRTIAPRGFNEPAGIFMYGGGADPQYRMRQFVARGNLIRNIDNRSDPNRTTPAYPGYQSFAEGLRMAMEPSWPRMHCCKAMLFV